MSEQIFSGDLLNSFSIAGSLGLNFDAAQVFVFDRDRVVLFAADIRQENDFSFQLTQANYAQGPVLTEVFDYTAIKIRSLSYWKKKIADVSLATSIEAMFGEHLYIPFQLKYQKSGMMVFHNRKKGQFLKLKGCLDQVVAVMKLTLDNVLIGGELDKLKQLLQDQQLVIERYKRQLEDDSFQLTTAVGGNTKEITGSGMGMQGVYKLMDNVAATNSTVLILGETGTGKELVAGAIHKSSPRRDGPMIRINCAALAPGLIESELFGHERGSFTGATERRIGKFELADNGTLFLDEIGDMPADVQVKVLRAISEREIQRIGGKTIIKVNVRIIAATNKNLWQEVVEGRFRSDLFYRINVFPITLPPLRDRKSDIPELARRFIERFARNFGKKIAAISDRVLQDMLDYDWPGNVRELEHLVERGVLLAKGTVIRQLDLPLVNRRFKKHNDEKIQTLEENERDHILLALKKANGKIFGKGGAADLLDIHVSTLNSRIKKLGIQKIVTVRKVMKKNDKVTTHK